MIGRNIKAICPFCDKEISGHIYEKENKVLMDKTCDEHGTLTDILSPDAELFKDRMSIIDHVSPNTCSMKKCRNGIFACKEHIGRRSPLAFIEITTKCNMKCPVCYADAGANGSDMPLEDVNKIIDTIAKMDPDTHIVLIGGEPTIHRDFFKILDKIRDNGLMKRTFIATNGITLANKEFSKKIHDAGIKKFYLGFDGTDREACKKIRGSYIAYDSVRKALENIRENGKAWIILSITAVKGLNVTNIPDTIDFAMDNNDIVKRIMVSPEAFCGRVTEPDKLTEIRLTGDYIENYLRDKLDVKVASVSISLFFSLLRPLKNMGLLANESWMGAMPSPFCGQMGMIWKDSNGKYHSLIDILVRNAAKKIYATGRRANHIADRINSMKSKIPDSPAGKILWKLICYFYLLPWYFLSMLPFLNFRGIGQMLGAFCRTGLNAKKFKQTYFPKRVELYFLMCSDKFNFLWDKMPYCLTHHYRLHPSTKEVIKIPGCSIIPFREAHE